MRIHFFNKIWMNQNVNVNNFPVFVDVSRKSPTAPDIRNKLQKAMNDKETQLINAKQTARYSTVI